MQETPTVPRSQVAMRAVALMLACLLASACAQLVAVQTADAATPFVAGSTSKAVRVAKTLTAKEKKAYKRALKACMDYRNQPNPIVVDVSDLGLNASQALHVGYLLHSNGELFWMNTYNDDSFGAKEFTIPCYFDDDTIDAMRAKLEKAVAKALKCVAKGMSQPLKVHALHDYLINKMDYQAKAKTAYDGLVNGKGDCYGFTKTMDLLLRRAGFTTDMAYNNVGTHSWNLVKVGGKWYHVDVTWDNGYTGQYNWAKGRLCHLYLLQSDAVMAMDSHKGWWAHHKCTTNTYKKMRLPDSANTFDLRCYEYKIFTKGFKYQGLKYKACGSKKVKLSAVSKAAKRKAKTLEIPATVTYKGKTYKVVGIEAGALAKAKAKTLLVASANFSAARVKGSLEGSVVKKIRLEGAAAKKKATYKKYFAKSNSGKSVTVS